MCVLQIHEDQVVMAHSPLKMFDQYFDKQVVISGQGPTTEIAHNLGFCNTTTVDELRQAFPQLDCVDHKRRTTKVIASPSTCLSLPDSSLTLLSLLWSLLLTHTIFSTPSRLIPFLTCLPHLSNDVNPPICTQNIRWLPKNAPYPSLLFLVKENLTCHLSSLSPL